LAKNHLSTSHPSIDTTLSDELIDAASQPIHVVNNPQCLFCDDPEHWDQPPDRIPKPDVHGPRKPLILTNSFQRHVSQHLEQIALFAVPSTIQDTEADEVGSTASQYARSNIDNTASVYEDAGESSSDDGITARQTMASDTDDPAESVETPSEEVSNLAGGKNPVTSAAPTSPRYVVASRPRKKPSMFTVGTSSGERDISLYHDMHEPSLPESGTKRASREHTSLKDPTGTSDPTRRATPDLQSNALSENDRPRPSTATERGSLTQRRSSTHHGSRSRERSSSLLHSPQFTSQYVVEDADGHKSYHDTREEAESRALRLNHEQRVDAAEAYMANKRGNPQPATLTTDNIKRRVTEGRDRANIGVEAGGQYREPVVDDYEESFRSGGGYSDVFERSAPQDIERRREDDSPRRSESTSRTAREQIGHSHGEKDIFDHPPDPQKAIAAEKTRVRVLITIRGRELDITELGLDKEYLETLPEELQEKAIIDRFAETRASK
jgi:hypothetical protein